MSKKHKCIQNERIQVIDLIKGVTLVFMVLFNYSVTLTYFNLIVRPENYLYSFFFPGSLLRFLYFFQVFQLTQVLKKIKTVLAAGIF